MVVNAVLDRMNQASLKSRALGFPDNYLADRVGQDLYSFDQSASTSADTSMATTRYMLVAGTHANVAVTFPLGEIDSTFSRSKLYINNINELQKQGVLVVPPGAWTSFGIKATCAALAADNLVPVIEELKDVCRIHSFTFYFPDERLDKSDARTRSPVSVADTEIAWLKETYELATAGKISVALRVMYGEIEDLFAAKNFLLLNHALSRVNLRYLTVELMVGLIRVTYRGRLVLPAWRALFVRIKEEMRCRDVPNWERLLVGLEAKNQP